MLGIKKLREKKSAKKCHEISLLLKLVSQYKVLMFLKSTLKCRINAKTKIVLVQRLEEKKKKNKSWSSNVAVTKNSFALSPTACAF